MIKPIVITSFKSVGCTFLDWSVLFLSGQDSHWSSKLSQQVPIPLDPLNRSQGVFNAHKHIKNHPMGCDNTMQMLMDLSVNGKNIATAYPFPLHVDKILCQFGVPLQTAMASPISNDQVLKLQIADYQKMLNLCQDRDIPMVFVESDPKALGYFWVTRSLDRMMLCDRSANSIDDLQEESDTFYFSNSVKTWQSLKLQDVWDRRERMALDMRPFDLEPFPKFGLDRSYLHINCMDLWNLCPQVIKECFDYLQMSIQQNRWDHWLSVANDWQQMQHQNLRFFNQLDHIIDAIINNWYFPLPTLDLYQESIIQHCLIYQHDLNLRTWKLDRFPDNTQKLHALLEQNIHKIPKSC